MSHLHFVGECMTNDLNRETSSSLASLMGNDQILGLKRGGEISRVQDFGGSHFDLLRAFENRSRSSETWLTPVDDERVPSIAARLVMNRTKWKDYRLGKSSSRMLPPFLR